MATQNIKIEYQVDKRPLVGANAELDEMIKNNDQLQKEAKNTTEELKKQGKEADGLTGTLKKTAGVLAAVFAADKIIDFGKEVFRVRGEMQRFSAVLTNTLGSKSAAQKALQQISKFAAETPFSVSQLTASFVKLANQGFKPTSNEMRKLGDLASSTGKEFDQLAEAIIDAQTGEFERLKEFGIRASKQGDQVKFTFKGVETQTRFTADAIKDYVLSLGDLQGVSGSMAAISTTLEGRISNLGDSYETLLNSIGERGQGVFAGAIGALGDLINATNEWVAIPVDENIRNEQFELNKLVTALNDSNISEESRRYIIGQITTNYPNFLKGQLNEKTSLDNINSALIDVNKQYEKRIKLAVREQALKEFQDELNESIESESQARIKLAEIEATGGRAQGKTRFELERTLNQILTDRPGLIAKIAEKEKMVNQAFKDVNNGKTEEELAAELSAQEEADKKKREADDASDKLLLQKKKEFEAKSIQATKDAAKLAAQEKSEIELEFTENGLIKDLDYFNLYLDKNLEAFIKSEEKKQDIRLSYGEAEQAYDIEQAANKQIKDDAEIERKRGNAELALSYSANLTGQLAALAGKETAFGKAASIAQATINVAQGVTKAFAQGGVAGFVTGALVAAAGAKSIAAIVSTPTPKFREGGYISGNSHDYGGVNIEAEGGEYMARRESVNKYGRSFFESLNNLEVHPDVISGLSGGSTPIIVKSDNSELINEYRNRPINNISISEEGITIRTKRNNSIVQKKVKRYTT